MPLLNYTTTIAATKTAAEIQTMLAKVGATRIMVEYTDRQPSGLAFELHGCGYRLPARFEAVHKVLSKDSAVQRRFKSMEQAQRVAWRVLRSWIEAQLAIIETGMVQADEVFLPYQMLQGGETVYDVYQRSDRMLPMWGSEG